MSRPHALRDRFHRTEEKPRARRTRVRFDHRHTPPTDDGGGALTVLARPCYRSRPWGNVFPQNEATLVDTEVES